MTRRARRPMPGGGRCPHRPRDPSPAPRGAGVAVLAGLLALVGGCVMGPDYRRPALELPAAYRDQVAPAEAASLADLPWWAVFRDTALQRLVAEAVSSNGSLRAAAARVAQYQALLGVARADYYPQLGYTLGAGRQRANPLQTGPVTANQFGGSLGASWELDLWGRIRRGTEAARAELLAAEESRRGVLLTLVGDVAEAYFGLLALDRRRAIARQTAASYTTTLELFTRRYENGVEPRLAVVRATANLAEARAALAEVELGIADQENRLAVLLGRPPGPIPRGAPRDTAPAAPEIPAGLPAQLLERRPDVRRAEAAAMSAAARVGAAAADFLPAFRLTGLFGAQSPELNEVLRGDAMIWNAAAAAAGPLFQGGRLSRVYRARKAQWDEAVAAYRETVLRALAEVATALAARQRLAEVCVQRAAEAAALREAVQLSLRRYELGKSSYYEVLEAQQRLFPAENAEAEARRDLAIVVVRLYRALGGGWQLPAGAWTPPAAAALSPELAH